MRNMFLMAFFGLFMVAGFTTQQGVCGLMMAPAFAGDDHESNSSHEDRNNGDEHAGNNDSNSHHEDSNKGNEHADNNDSKDSSNDSSSKDDSKDNSNDSASKDSGSSDDQASTAFHCPAGVTTCYSADGQKHTDLNNLPATAAGPGSTGSGAALMPTHMRSL